MIRIGDTTYDDSQKNISYERFCKLIDILGKFKNLNPEKKEKAINDEYFKLTGKQPEKKEVKLKEKGE